MGSCSGKKETDRQIQDQGRFTVEESKGVKIEFPDLPEYYSALVKDNFQNFDKEMERKRLKVNWMGPKELATGEVVEGVNTAGKLGGLGRSYNKVTKEYRYGKFFNGSLKQGLIVYANGTHEIVGKQNRKNPA